MNQTSEKGPFAGCALRAVAAGVGGLAAACISMPALGGIVVSFSGPSGLAAEAEFTVVNPTTLQVRLENLSTGVPNGFSNSDQILTGLSWDFGPAGVTGITITGGSVAIGPDSQSLNFSAGAFGAGADVSGEWGFGNGGGSGALINFISANQAQATPFGGANIDGPAELNGPQGGLVADPPIVALGGLGAIAHEIIATLNLSGPIDEATLLGDILANGTRVEFGSDAAFVTGKVVPGPGAIALLAGVLTLRRRRRAD